MDGILAALGRHEHIALQFSGGKDSLAVLELMRPYLDRITVYWCNSGDPLPEHAAFVRAIGASLPRFIEIEGRVKEVVATMGMPSDIVPFASSNSARILGVLEGTPLNDRYACCYKSIMEPMHERMLADGITLVIRGQKDADRLKGMVRSGEVDDFGMEHLHPIEAWTDAEVFDFLGRSGVEMPDHYGFGIGRSLDCALCTAWLEENRGAYLLERHPDLYLAYKNRIMRIAAAVQPAGDNFIKEMEA